MTKLTDVATRKVQHLCIFGDPKSGKSELAASATSLFRRVIWVSLDNGHEVLFKLPREQQEKIELVRLPDTKDFPTGITASIEIVSGKSTAICDAHGQVRCLTCRKEPSSVYTTVETFSMQRDELIVFDHLSQMADSAMNLAMKGKSLDTKPEWPEYSHQGAMMSKVLSNIQQANYNVICIAHVCETEMEDGSKRLVPLVGTVPFSRNVGKYFDHIIYCRVGNKKHAFGSATTYIASVLTGSRTDVSLESQVVEEGKRSSLAPFFEGKMEHLSSSSLSSPVVLPPLSPAVVEEESKVEGVVELNGGTLPEEVLSPEIPAASSISSILPPAAISLPPAATLSPAEASKARIAAMRSKSQS